MSNVFITGDGCLTADDVTTWDGMKYTRNEKHMRAVYSFSVHDKLCCGGADLEVTFARAVSLDAAMVGHSLAGQFLFSSVDRSFRETGKRLDLPADPRDLADCLIGSVTPGLRCQDERARLFAVLKVGADGDPHCATLYLEISHEGLCVLPYDFLPTGSFYNPAAVIATDTDYSDADKLCQTFNRRILPKLDEPTGKMRIVSRPPLSAGPLYVYSLGGWIDLSSEWLPYPAGVGKFPRDELHLHDYAYRFCWYRASDHMNLLVFGNQVKDTDVRFWLFATIDHNGKALLSPDVPVGVKVRVKGRERLRDFASLTTLDKRHIIKQLTELFIVKNFASSVDLGVVV